MAVCDSQLRSCSFLRGIVVAVCFLVCCKNTRGGTWVNWELLFISVVLNLCMLVFLNLPLGGRILPFMTQMGL